VEGSDWAGTWIHSHFANHHRTSGAVEVRRDRVTNIRRYSDLDSNFVVLIVEAEQVHSGVGAIKHAERQ
jgi:hypothetical protein